jgi:hypothetical protein
MNLLMFVLLIFYNISYQRQLSIVEGILDRLPQNLFYYYELEIMSFKVGPYSVASSQFMGIQQTMWKSKQTSLQ